MESSTAQFLWRQFAFVQLPKLLAYLCLPLLSSGTGTMSHEAEHGFCWLCGALAAISLFLAFGGQRRPQHTFSAFWL